MQALRSQARPSIVICKFSAVTASAFKNKQTSSAPSKPCNISSAIKNTANISETPPRHTPASKVTHCSSASLRSLNPQITLNPEGPHGSKNCPEQSQKHKINPNRHSAFLLVKAVACFNEKVQFLLRVLDHVRVKLHTVVNAKRTCKCRTPGSGNSNNTKPSRTDTLWAPSSSRLFHECQSRCLCRVSSLTATMGIATLYPQFLAANEPLLHN